jgi:hypothetical protein
MPKTARPGGWCVQARRRKAGTDKVFTAIAFVAFGYYMSNHIAVAYGDLFGETVAASQALGIKVRVLMK